ncbi:unnamed protein product [Paramecium primaurelia]|uniref:Uncharacterized protein n=1 Tax=Paramecium primaurelia TaxID=5886 RepID=A0A8S1LY47_PARPR|nr:unnamed protein product [Paramecium primaurelia]
MIIILLSLIKKKCFGILITFINYIYKYIFQIPFQIKQLLSSSHCQNLFKTYQLVLLLSINRIHQNFRQSQPRRAFQIFFLYLNQFFQLLFPQCLQRTPRQLNLILILKLRLYYLIITSHYIFFQISKKSKHIKKNKNDVHEYTEEKKKEIEKEYQQIKKSNQLHESYEPKIQNVVSTVILKMKTKTGEDIDKLDLDNLAHTSQNCEYKKSRFPALIQRIKEPKSTALIFEAGKMVITGTKGQNEAEEAANKV